MFTEVELAEKIRTIRELEAIIAEANTEIESLKDEIKAHMTETKEEHLNVDIFKVHYTTVQSNRFDTTTFKKEHNAMYEQYVKTIESKRFQII